MNAQMTHDLALIFGELVDKLGDFTDILIVQEIPYLQNIFRFYQLGKDFVRVHMFGF